MDIRKLQRAIVDGLEDVKAQHINVFNTEHLSAMFERVIIASGTSNRQTKALAASVRDSVKSRGMEVMSTEGEDNGEWIIVDCGAAVAHIMQPAIREYYHLEEIWGGKSVNVKMGAATTGLVKASEPDKAAKPAARKAAGKTAATGAVKTATKRAPAQQAPAKQAPTRRATSADIKMAAAKRAANQTAAAKRVATTRPAPRKSASPVAPARKTAAKTVVRTAAKAPAKRAAVKSAAPAKKAPARKRSA